MCQWSIIMSDGSLFYFSFPRPSGFALFQNRSAIYTISSLLHTTLLLKQSPRLIYCEIKLNSSTKLPIRGWIRKRTFALFDLSQNKRKGTCSHSLKDASLRVWLRYAILLFFEAWLFYSRLPRSALVFSENFPLASERDKSLTSDTNWCHQVQENTSAT